MMRGFGVVEPVAKNQRSAQCAEKRRALGAVRRGSKPSASSTSAALRGPLSLSARSRSRGRWLRARASAGTETASCFRGSGEARDGVRAVAHFVLHLAECEEQLASLHLHLGSIVCMASWY